MRLQIRQTMNPQFIPPNEVARLSRFKMSWVALLAGLALTAMAPVAGEGLLQQNGSSVPPAVNRMPDAADRARMEEGQQKQQNFLAINAERRKQIADDSATLLKLATDLKAEVDKTNKDTLSISVIKKAEAIEKLARSVKEKMKLTVGAS